MKKSSKRPISPKTLRLLIFAWMGLVVVAGAVTFIILLVTFNNRDQRLAAELPTPTVEVPELPAAEAPQPTTPVEGQDAGTPPLEVTPPLTVGLDEGFALGGHAKWPIEHPEVMREAGMTWIKIQIEWNTDRRSREIEPIIQAARENGFKILLGIVGAEKNPQEINFERYVRFLERVSEFQPDAIEVWNEMNLDREWPAGQISPSAYVTNMLAPAYTAIKAVSPNTTVIIGALAPTGFDNDVNVWSDDRYVAGLAAAGAANYADCIGVHHNSGTTSPSARTGRPEGDHYSWYFLPTVEMYYNGMGNRLPVCITEFGYLTPEGFDTPLPEFFAWGSSTTVAQQASWLAEGVQIAQQVGYIPLMIIWNVDYDLWGDDPQGGYAILRPDGTCPACAALRQALND